MTSASRLQGDEIRTGDPAPRFVVVGGGITGLAAARRLALLAPEAVITLIEREERLGGKIVTERVDGFTIEGGPDSFLSVKPRGIGLCEELGLEGQLQGTDERHRRTFVMKAGRLQRLPEGLTGLIPSRLGPMTRTGLISPLGKARMALDFVLPRKRDERDETLAAFIERRLGREVYDRLIEPLMAGIYAGDGRQLSLAATFPQLRMGEVRHGGLIKGVLAAKRAGPIRNPAAPTRPPFLSPCEGMDALVAALEADLRDRGCRLVTGIAVTEIGQGPESSAYRLRLGDGRTLTAAGVLLATPAFAAADLLDGLDPGVAVALRAITHVSTATVSVAYRAVDLPRPLDGYGYVVPRIEGRPVLACTWTSSKWHHRAPDGHVLIRGFIGRAGQEAVLSGSDAELLALVREEFRQMLGITAEPLLHRVFRWPQGMPQYTLGHLDRVAAVEARLAARPGLLVAGHAYRGVGIPDCIRSGETAAEQVLAAVQAARSREAA